MASAAVDLLIGKISNLLQNEVYLLAGVRDDVKSIQAELRTMKSFLEEKDTKQSSNKVEKDWVGNVRDVTYEVEDIIDEFIYHMNSQRTGSRLSRFLYNVTHMPKNLWVRHQIGVQLKNIRNTIKEISERAQRYGVDQSNSSIPPRSNINWKQFQGEACLLVKEEQLVGIDKDKQILMSWLTDEDTNQAVISVLGMGGSGKTTLIAQTYNSNKVTRYFNCYAWITVSQIYILEDLLRRLIKDFYKSVKEHVPADLDAMGSKELLEMIVNYLSSKRYLVVLDDVWDINLWEEIKFALPDDYVSGSRIVITTRKEDIATRGFGVRSHVHRVQPLEPSEAWKLFCLKAFYSHPDNVCPEELKAFAREIVEKCEGLPLALVTLGGLMFSKKHVFDWSKICNSLNWHLSNNPMLDSVKSILLLSFKELPYYLKHCFLYCSMFPEDFVIQRKRIIRLWIGEGFVDAREENPEEMADEYLMELTFKNMLQVVRRNAFGRPKACKMHDLMREIAIGICKKEKFCAFNNGEEEIDSSEVRRLSVQFQKIDGQVGLNLSSDLSKLRSLLVFYPKYVQDSLLTMNYSGLKLLKVLDLQEAPIDNLPDEIVKNLFNLRYLNLKRTLVKELPRSIGRLRNLHTLDIRQSKIEVLPDEVGKLKNLRHLLTYRYSDESEWMNFRMAFGFKPPKGIYKLNKLQILSCISVEGDIIIQLRNMTQLKEFGITNVRQKDGTDLCETVMKMRCLEELIVMASDEEEILEMNALKSPPPLLKVVYLIGKLERVPSWLCLLQNLMYLGLHWTRLTQDLLPHIAALPWLISMTLSNAYVGEKLCFREGFAKLVTLELFNMPELSGIEIEKGVMTDLSSIHLASLMKLKRVPSGIEFLSKLEKIWLLSVSTDLIQAIAEEGETCVDRLKERIPYIIHFQHNSSGKYQFENLSRPQTVDS